MNAMQMLMGEAEARVCVKAIRDGIEGVRHRVLDLHEREGWRALGYQSWRECVTAEFGQSQAYLYRLLNAAQIEAEVSPMGETSAIPERQLRELAPLRDEPEAMRAVWQQVVEEMGDKATAAGVREAVRLFKEVPESPQEQSGTVEHWKNHDIVHTSVGRLNVLRQIDPAAYVERLGGLAALTVFLENDLEIAEASSEWLRAYAAALRVRLGVSGQKGLRAV